MSAKVEIEAGICGFKTTVDARSADYQNVEFTIQSDCPKVGNLAKRLNEMGPIDAYMEIHPSGPDTFVQAAKEPAVGCCVGCVVPTGIFKAMQVAAGLSLPKDISIKIRSEE